VVRAAPDCLDRLRAVGSLGLADCWIAAGAIRNPVWDRLHGYANWTAPSDIDVVWHDRTCATLERDLELERFLDRICPGHAWSVKNQARMHLRNADAPYSSTMDAMRSWPETATAIVARVGPSGTIEIASPFGFNDLIGLIVRPTPSERGKNLASFEMRVRKKRWPERWPRLRIAL